MSGPISLNQQVTLWKVIGENGSGGKLYSAPQVVDGKFALVNEQFRTEVGDIVMSKAVFYTEAEFVPNTYYVLFDSSVETTPPKEAEEVKGIKQNPSMFGDLKKGWI